MQHINMVAIYAATPPDPPELCNRIPILVPIPFPEGVRNCLIPVPGAAGALETPNINT